MKPPIANIRARRHLMKHLPRRERRRYRWRRRIHVVGSAGREYVITTAWAGNVIEPAAALRWCIRLHTSYPRSDSVLAIKLMIETNEPKFRRVACFTYL